jgi:two-component system sensor histidine kinase ChvG
MRRPSLSFNRPSRIGLRLLAFNLLVVFVPVTGVLYLDVYETRLRQAQESSLVQQARVLAAALGGAAAPDAGSIAQLFMRIERRSDARFRVYDAAGQLIADSARHSVENGVAGKTRYEEGEDADVRGRLLYRAGAWLANARARAGSLLAPRKGASAPSIEDAPGRIPSEVGAALAGRYGATTRLSAGQRSVTFFSAVPIRHQGAVTGVVVASQSTMRILQDLYAIRLRIFQIVIGSLAAAAVLTALAAATIVRPLTRLRRRAAVLTERRGRLHPAVFPGASRKDEIGALARALGELTRRTNDHIDLLQSFSADVSHELKNPLASIRTAAEMMADAETSDERRKFRDLMVKDVARLERLVSGLRDVARVEGQIEADLTESIDPRELLREVVARANATTAQDRCVKLVVEPGVARVIASPERLAQVFDNLLENAASFSPAASTTVVALTQADQWVVVTVDDEGPGIPDAHLERVFTRFFSYRPGDTRREHVGLGLAIARQIVESYGGAISAANRPGSGARFEVRLPNAGSRKPKAES